VSRRGRGRASGSRPPTLVVAIAIIGLLIFFVAPLAALLQRAPWGDVWSILTAPEVRDALRLSLECSLAATGLSIVFGLPIAWLLARVEFRGKAVVRAFAILPMVLPPVVGGVALLWAFGRRGLVGQYLYQWFDVTLPFTTKGVIIAETFVAMPFLIITVEAALRSLDTRYEDAAATLGASRWTVLRRVILPAIGPSLAAGAALTWARALGEFGATITFAGNFRGVTQTTPLAVYEKLLVEPGTAIVLSLVLLTVSVVVLALVGRRVFGARSVGAAAA
jgi:molybdate transport system permease protein